MQIYFIRHGRTQYNLEHRFQGGRADSPLVESGIAGAKAAGVYLQNVEFSAVYSSPQQRALDTAKYIVAANHWQPEIQVDDGLREFDFGDWDGLKEDEVQPQSYAPMIFTSPAEYQPELAGGGEDYATFVARITGTIHQLVDQVGVSNTKPLLVVSHGLVTTMTVKALMGVPLAKLRAPFIINGQEMKTVGHGIVDNDSLTVLSTPDNRQFELTRWNETGYLE
ncbi:phosphoglycerate mutase [Lactiplantibacillus plantarum EGD-AQ4]|nr:histidine phosphatase family protein [Lactiplantibacillus pentosus]EIW14656.1 phosphoglycerate mutase family protein [Lactiplantibacillus pentosus KCA1]EQM53688.1 phosphoglycerate mutase [Lactiplantibacillus plantarum EGD-AQ4]